MNFNQLINEIRKLNPNVEIRVGDPQFDSLASERIFSSVPMEQLKLPEGYYSNEKNGITNKHNTETGLYTTLSVESLDDMVVGQTLPSVDASKPLETTNVEEIAIALQRLNPGVSIRLSNPELDSEAYRKIYCSVPVSDLALPQPFYYNEKNGITNKHQSATGQYAAIDVEDLSKANPSMLVRTRYNLEEEKRRQYDIDIQRAEQKRQAKMGTQSYDYDPNMRAPRETSETSYSQPTQTNSNDELTRMAREKRKFTILQRERAMNDAQRAKNRSAIMAGICILGAAVAIYFNGQDVNQVLQHELNAIYSWDALGQYIQDLGPLTTLLSAGAGGFIAKYFKNSRKLKQAQNEFVDFNNSLENTKTEELGGNENAKSR